MWSFFDRRVCLTLGPDWPIVCTEFERVGLDGVWRFDAIPIDGGPIHGPHQSFNASVRRILKDFYVSDAERLLFLEDDVVFQDLSHLETALSELPETWDIVYLGANLVCWNNGEPQPERYSEHLFRVKAAWTTHAVAYNKRVIPFLLANQPGLSECMFDNALSSWLPNLNAYCVAPMVAYQRPHHSTIWIKPEVDDYANIFAMSEEKLR